MTKSTDFPGESSPQQGSRFPEGTSLRKRPPKSKLVHIWFSQQLAAGHDINSFPASIITDDTAANRTAVTSVVNEGGNARGANAVDFQSVRSFVTDVASGDNAVISGGRGNEASGNDSAIGGGDSNTASGNYAFIGSGEDNEATNTYAAICGGYANVASGYASSIGGGYYNTTSGAYATVGGGYQNTASGAYATIPWGRQQ